MASRANLALLREAGLLASAVEAGPNDLLMAVEGDDEAALGGGGDRGRAGASSASRHGRRRRPRAASRREASRWRSTAMPAANLALISTPGDYAAAEAMKALRLGLNVMLFSDNVAVEDEIALKRYARAHDLIVMGPDCGTAIIDGIPLGFANVVRRGDDRRRRGVRHRPAAGHLPDRSLGRRASARRSAPAAMISARDVGGITMLQGLARARGRPRHPGRRADLEAARARESPQRCWLQREAGRQAGGGRTSSAPTRVRSRAAEPALR